MIWIEVIMAFAVTMMGFASIVSMIVEMIHRIFRLREEKLKMMLAQVYTNQIAPMVGQCSGTPLESGDDFAEKITDPDFIPTVEGRNPLKKLLHIFLNVKNTKQMSVLEFIEKLARTDQGKRLLEQSRIHGETQLKIFLEDLVSQYGNYEKSAREYFTRRARFFSVFVAIGLAMSLNINPIEICNTYLNDTTLRTNIISKSEVIEEQLTVQMQRLEQIKHAASLGDDDQIKELKSTYERLNNSLSTLQTAQVPFGWGTPCMEEALKAKKTGGLFSPIFLKWFFSVVLGGILIGLGGPFWFDLFKKMSCFLSLTASTGESEGQPKESPENAGENKAEKAIADPLTTFKRAATVMAYTGDSQAPLRPLFDRDGNVLKGEHT